MRAPSRETVAFLVALAAIAALGGVAAASVAGAAPTATMDDGGEPAVDAAPNATIDHDGDRLNVEQSADATIAGSTTLDRGDQLTIRVRSSGESPFLKQTVVNVSATGEFETTMDFSDVERGTEFTVSVRYNGTELASADGVVGECDPACGESGGTATLDGSVFSATAGDVAEIPVALEGRETATVVVGGDGTNVRIPVTVTDGSGDGRVVLQLATEVDDGSDAGVSTKASADSVRVHDDVDRPATLDPGEYPVDLYPAADDTGNAGDIAVLSVTEATEELGTTRTEGTTVGTIYGNGTTSVPSPARDVSLGTVGILAVGGVLAVLGIVALVGDFG